MNKVTIVSLGISAASYTWMVFEIGRFHGTKFTARALYELVERTSSKLRALGVEPPPNPFEKWKPRA